MMTFTRQQALDWLACNITRWPVDCSGLAPIGWSWRIVNGEIYLMALKQFVMPIREHEINYQLRDNVLLSGQAQRR